MSASEGKADIDLNLRIKMWSRLFVAGFVGGLNRCRDCLGETAEAIIGLQLLGVGEELPS